MTATLLDGGAWLAPQVCNAAGVTYRQLDYWARCGYVVPSVATGYGSGNRRLYSTADVVAIAVMAALVRTGAGGNPALVARIARRASVQGVTVEVALGDHVTLVVDVAAIRSAMAERLAA